MKIRNVLLVILVTVGLIFGIGCNKAGDSGSDAPKEKPAVEGSATTPSATGMIMCSGCNMDHKPADMKDVGEGRMLCTDCGCADMTKCDSCGMELVKADTKDVSGKMLCAKCAAETASATGKTTDDGKGSGTTSPDTSVKSGD